MVRRHRHFTGEPPQVGGGPEPLAVGRVQPKCGAHRGWPLECGCSGLVPGMLGGPTMCAWVISGEAGVASHPHTPSWRSGGSFAKG